MIGLVVARLFLCLAGVGCVVGGITAFVLASQGERAHEVEAYQRVVDVWPERRRAFDAISSLVLRSVPEGATMREVRLARVSVHDPFRDYEDRRGLPSFESLVFTAAPVNETSASEVPEGVMPTNFLPIANFSSIGPVAHAQGTEVWGTSVTFLLRIDGQDLELDDLPLVQAVAHWEPGGIYDRCPDLGGVHAGGGKCWVFQRLQSLCIQVAQNDAGVWQLAERFPAANHSYGCAYARNTWQAAVYHTEPRPSGFNSRGNFTNYHVANFSDFSVEVRSAHDPYFTALALTHGSLRLPWSRYEEIVLGVVLLIMGIAFTAQPCYLLWRSKRIARARRGHYPGGALAEIRRMSPSSRATRYTYGDVDAETIGMKAAVA